jgi:hypothetical protein
MTVVVVSIAQIAKHRLQQVFYKVEQTLCARAREKEKQRERREAVLGQFGPHMLRVQNQKSSIANG